MPTGNELAGVGNLLALPLTLKWMHDQWEQQKAAQGQLAAGAQVAGPGAPTTTTMPQQQLGPEPPNPSHLLQTPVLGTALRGIGTVGQVLQVMGMPPPKAPRPPTMKESWEFQHGQQKAESARKISEMMTDPQLKELAKIDPGKAISIQLGPYGSEWKAYAAGVLQKDPNKSLEDVVKDFEAMKTQQAGQRAGETTTNRLTAEQDVLGLSKMMSPATRESLMEQGIDPRRASVGQVADALSNRRIQHLQQLQSELAVKHQWKPLQADAMKSVITMDQSINQAHELETLAQDPQVQQAMGVVMGRVNAGLYSLGVAQNPKVARYIQLVRLLRTSAISPFLHGSRHAGIWAQIQQHLPDIGMSKEAQLERTAGLVDLYTQMRQQALQDAQLTLGGAAEQAGAPAAPGPLNGQAPSGVPFEVH